MTNQAVSLFLVGPMGAGKSTLGRHLARQLGRVFYDSDKEIEARTGADIPWIFDCEGEAGFRQREAKVIADLTAIPGIVLATGGGSVLDENSRQYLHERGHVVYLQTPVALQLSRTHRDRNRPLLQKEDPEAILQQLLDQRDPLYRQVAHQVVSTASNNMKKVAGEILAALK